MKYFDLTTILPLIGVAVGWLLSETGMLFRERRAEKRILGKAIFGLLTLRNLTIIELRRIAIAKSYARANSLPENRERLAQLAGDKRETQISEFLATKDSLLSEVGTFDPFLAFELNKNFQSVSSILSSSGGYLSVYPEGTVEELWDDMFLESEEFAFNMLASEVRAAVLRVAWRKSVFSRVKAWWYFKKNSDEVYDESTLDGIQAIRERLKKLDETSKRKAAQATKNL